MNRENLSPGPVVSIGLLVHNAEAFVSESIDSVRSQSFEDWELIISDDASTDATNEIVMTYVAEDERIRVQRHDVNVGAIENFNSVIGAGVGELCWCSDHDRWKPDYLKRAVGALRDHPDAVLAYTASRRIGLSGEVLGEVVPRIDTRGQRQLARLGATLWETPANTGCVYGVMRRSLLKEIHRYPGIYPHTVAPDVLLLLELSLLGEFVFVDEVLFELRELSAEHGTAKQYLHRLRLSPNSRGEGVLRFADFVRSARRIVRDHVEAPRERRWAELTAMITLVENYGWLLPELISIGGEADGRSE